MIDIQTELKLILSRIVAEDVKQEKKQYFYDLINSIPEDLLNTKNPIVLMSRGKKLSAFINSIISEMAKEGVEKSKIEKEIKQMNDRAIKTMKRGLT